MIKRLIIFLIINFLGLAIGTYFTTPGVSSDWYQAMDKAPWTPPGWVFGASWTTIMICFSIYLALLWDEVEDSQSLLFLYISMFILNVLWNPVFFYMQYIGIGLIVISALTLLVLFMMSKYWSYLKSKSLLLAPYAIWMCIATSLNAYAWMMN